MKLKHLFGYVTTVMLSFTACTGDNSDIMPEVVTASCAIQSRASGDTQPETLPNELINNWWVAFVDASGTVRSIVENSPQLASPVERDEFTVDLPVATYTLYAFANLSKEQLYQRTGVKFVVGEKLVKEPSVAVWDNMTNNPEKTALIPMSGTTTIDFRNTQSFTVEVIRMLAKVRISVQNTSSAKLEVKRLSFGILNRGPVRLLPDYKALESCPDIMESAKNGKEELTFDNMNVSLGVNKSMTHTFYVRESAAKWTHPTGRYFVTFTVSRPDGATADEHYAITDDLQWIQRNDFIDIPIVISDMTIDWSVLFYPPIGGYPAVMTEVEGDTHFMTFGTSGKFRIRPEIKDNNRIVPPADYDFEITEINGDKKIFTNQPEKNTVTGEIIGELSSVTGTATLDCKVTVRYDGYETVRTRRLYIIRK
ncbi:FimB/Mfa2 family fimbrial subunit [uncultured Duncaniella sp.]|uniref:FimB/Mfa2 family fimbrial subunit n=1 Tax=uncultured Duncaniella sp. TaxID=2768039 RepID=UPI002616B737|nr:FimB/Mfa2 family fimbrial subunit [uncultured Duncaniella sp.]